MADAAGQVAAGAGAAAAAADGAAGGLLIMLWNFVACHLMTN